MKLAGFHHLTAITAKAKANVDFYTNTLGLRLVKKSVNQDDVTSYHLYYADAIGSPGTTITFFDWPAVRERPGTRSIVRTAFRVGSEESLRYWRDRFGQLGVGRGGIVERDGRKTLDFEDPEGMRLSLVVDDPAGPADQPWDQSPVPAEHRLRGLGPVLISVSEIASTHAVLTNLLNMNYVRQYTRSHTNGTGGEVMVKVYTMDSVGPAAELHVAVEPELAPGRLGAGGVHHVAFRIPTLEQYEAWANRLTEASVRSSGPVDRFYFRSLYFREPNGILFELATDAPGFTADEPPETLGQTLALPPFLEPRRQEIEAGLKPL